MPRRREVPKRVVPPDPVFQSPLVTKFINAIMERGKKTVAEDIFYGAMDVMREKTKDDPLKAFKKALDNVKPVLEVKARRVGGSTYQIPVEVAPNRRLSLGIRWLITYAQERPGRSMREKLANEMLDAANNTGGAIKKR